MIGGWQLFTRPQGKAMFGNQKDGSLTEEKFIFVMIVGIILEHKKNLFFRHIQFLTLGLKLKAVNFTAFLLFHRQFSVQNFRRVVL